MPKTPGPVSAAETAWTKEQELNQQQEINRKQLTANRPVNEFTPYGIKNWTDWGGDHWTSSETLSPNEQALYDANTASQLRGFDNEARMNPYMLNTAKMGYEQTQRDAALAKETNPQRRQALIDQYAQTARNAALAKETNPQKRQALLDQYATEKLASAQDRSQLGYAKNLMGQLPGKWNAADTANKSYADFTKTAANDKLNMTGLGGIINASPAERKRLEDAMYAKSRSRLDPQYEEEQRKLNLQMAQSGFDPTSQAYASAMAQFGRTKNDAYSGARNDAIEFGGTEEQRQLEMQINARRNALGERQAGVSNIRDSRNQRLGELSSKADMYSNAAKDASQNYLNMSKTNRGINDTSLGAAPPAAPSTTTGGNASSSGSSYARTNTQPYERKQIGGQNTAQMAGTEVGTTQSDALQKANDVKRQNAAAKQAQIASGVAAAASVAVAVAAAVA